MATQSKIDYYLSLIPSDERDQQIDNKHRNTRGHIIDRDLGSIADEMPHWVGNIATAALELTPNEIAEIQMKHLANLVMQKREALQKWKSRLGAAATPRALITAFLGAGADTKYVDAVCNVLGKKLKSHGSEADTQVVKNTTAGVIVDNATPAVKKIKTETGSSVSGQKSTIVPDSGDIDDSGLAAAQNKASSTENANQFNWCSYTGQQVQSTATTIIQGAQSAALQRGVTLWDKQKVSVSFTGTTVHLLNKWNMKQRDILALANKWHQLQDSKQGETNYIPEFVSVVEDGDIIVELNENGINQACPGNAGRAGSDEPTMWLDLSGKDTTYNKYLVVHEFGHALGLGHEHQRSDFRECVIPFLDEEKMEQRVTKERYKDWDVDIKLDADKCTDYDDKSVMHYWFDKTWLKFGYDNKKKIEENFAAGILSEKMRKALLGVHSCSGALPIEPSSEDLKFINGVYEEVFSKQPEQ